jgi:hypothetical protein
LVDGSPHDPLATGMILSGPNAGEDKADEREPDSDGEPWLGRNAPSIRLALTALIWVMGGEDVDERELRGGAEEFA